MIGCRSIEQHKSGSDMSINVIFNVHLRIALYISDQQRTHTHARMHACARTESEGESE